MGFEQSPFGDGSASGAGNVTTSVSNHYNSRASGHPNGVYDGDGLRKELVIGFDFNDLNASELPLLNPVIPARARVVDVVLINKVAGVGAGILEIGTDTSEITNGFSVSNAQLIAAANTVVNLTAALSGTWDLEKALVADTIVNIAFSTTSATAGEFEVVITYILEPK